MFDPLSKILIVDDMSTMRKIVKKIMRDLGYSNFDEAADGNQAWEKVQAGSFDLIVSDWNMPNCSGLDFLKRVRSDPRVSKTPFLLVTAEAEQHQVAEAIRSGVDQYVVKPFTTDSLKAKLESAYKKCSARKSA